MIKKYENEVHVWVQKSFSYFAGLSQIFEQKLCLKKPYIFKDIRTEEEKAVQINLSIPRQSQYRFWKSEKSTEQSVLYL